MIGVLALQGGHKAHREMLDLLSLPSKDLRLKEDFEGISALVLPGGESTTILRLIEHYELLASIRSVFEAGLPILATCAGLIILSEKVLGLELKPLALLPVTVQRNHYGSQKDSFCESIDFPSLGIKKQKSFFIRAPHISALSQGVEPLAYLGEAVVAVRYKNITALSFHPELSEDTRFHQKCFDSCLIKQL